MWVACLPDLINGSSLGAPIHLNMHWNPAVLFNCLLGSIHWFRKKKCLYEIDISITRSFVRLTYTPSPPPSPSIPFNYFLTKCPSSNARNKITRTTIYVCVGRPDTQIRFTWQLAGDSPTHAHRTLIYTYASDVVHYLPARHRLTKLIRSIAKHWSRPESSNVLTTQIRMWTLFRLTIS